MVHNKNMDYIILQKLEKIEKLLLERPLYPKWLTLRQAEEYCNLSNSTLNRLIRQSKLKASKVTGKTLIKVDLLDKYLENK